MLEARVVNGLFPTLQLEKVLTLSEEVSRSMQEFYRRSMQRRLSKV